MIKKVQLKNGLTVLKNLQTKSPVVSLQVWIDNGSANESEDVAGVSHFIEHLLFKGTRSFGPGEIAQSIEGAGGQLNAYTSFDQTVYYMTLGSSSIDIGLKALSEMIFHPLFDEHEVNNEREVVIEEIRRGLDEPSRVNSQFAFKSFFKNHPYGRPIIGYDHIIENISVDKIKEYFYKHYHPDKTFLLVTGDFDETNIDVEIKKYFDVPAKTSSYNQVFPKLPVSSIPEFLVQPTNFEETVFNLYWPSAALNTKDYVCLEILALILGQGESSCLYQALKLDAPIVKTIGCYAYSLKQPGVFAINFKPMSGQESKSLIEFQKELIKICEKGISLSDYEKAVINFKSEMFYSMETCDGLARQVGQSFFYEQDENHTEKYLKLLDKISLQDVESVFNAYILNVPPKLYVSASKNENYVDEIKTIFENNFLEGLKLKKSNTLKPEVSLKWSPKISTSSEIQDIQLSGGTRLYIKAQNETPVVQMDMVFLGGEKIDAIKGVNALLAQKCWGRETASLSEAEVVYEFDKLASSHSVFSGKHSLGMQVSTLSPFLDRMIELNFALLRNTQISNRIVERDHEFIKQFYENRKDNPTQMAFQEFMKLMFEGHYYENDAIESLSLMEKVDTNNLSKYIDSHFDPKNLVISVVGDVDAENIAMVLENEINSLKKVNKTINFKTFEGLKKDKSSEINLDKEQAQIVFGFEGLRYNDPRKATLAVIQSILSGQGGRLFLELRDKASLAYTVSPIGMEGQESGYFGSYIACAPSKKAKAIGMMQAEFEKLVTKAVSKEELQAAKASLIGRAEIALQRNSEIAEKILFDAVYGLAFNSYLNYSEAILQVTSEDIQTLMSELYARPKVLVTLG